MKIMFCIYHLYISFIIMLKRWKQLFNRVFFINPKCSVILGNNTSHTYCPPSFHHIGSGCYFYGYFKLNWFRAMEFCHSMGEGVSLATIEEREENYEVKTWLLKHGKWGLKMQIRQLKNNKIVIFFSARDLYSKTKWRLV